MQNCNAVCSGGNTLLETYCHLIFVFQTAGNYFDNTFMLSLCYRICAYVNFFLFLEM